LTPVSPTRFLDTRNGTGAPKARIGAGGIVELKVAGTHGIPAAGVTAVVMNVTAVRPTTGGYITVYPDGQSLPAVSNINFPAGRTIPNMVVVPVVNGSVDLRNSAGSVDLLADVTGYFSATGSTFTPAGPLRLLDTRSGLGARPGAVAPGGLVSLPVTGTAGVLLRGHGSGAQRDGHGAFGRGISDGPPARSAGARGLEPQLRRTADYF
jgi:hypothetical protein